MVVSLKITLIMGLEPIQVGLFLQRIPILIVRATTTDWVITIVPFQARQILPMVLSTLVKVFEVG